VLDARGGLPSGRVATRLLVSDGFHTAASRLLVDRSAQAAGGGILSPREVRCSSRKRQDAALTVATDARGHRCPTRRLAGSSTTVATGLDAFVEARSQATTVPR
jgi:hypothetical protein